MYGMAIICAWDDRPPFFLLNFSDFSPTLSKNERSFITPMMNKKNNISIDILFL